MFDSPALSLFGMAAIGVAVLSAFAVGARWRAGGLLLAAAVWAAGSGLRGELPWPNSFEISFLCFVAACLLAVFGQRFSLTLPAVLLLWLWGAWIDSSSLSAGAAIRGLHHLSVVACAGIGLAAFSRIVALAWQAEPTAWRDAKRQREGWKAVSIASGLLLVVLVLTVVFELWFIADPLGLEPPLGLLVALAEAIAGICLWRATVQTHQLEEGTKSLNQASASPGWSTSVGLMVVFLLTGLAFAMVPIIATAV